MHCLINDFNCRCKIIKNLPSKIGRGCLLNGGMGENGRIVDVERV